MAEWRVLTPDAQYADDARVERAVAGEGVHIDVHRVRSFDDIPDDEIGSAQALVVWHEVAVTRDVISRLPHCRIIVRAGVGFDNVDCGAAAEVGIPVCNTPDYGTSEVADHAIGLLLALRRGIGFHLRRLAADPVGAFHWSGAPLVGRLRGTRLGIVGLGRIGTATALRARALGMEVLFHDPYVPRGQEIALGLTRLERLDELLSLADAVSLHAPLTEETHHLIDADALRRMPPGAVLVNTARGPLIDLDALYTALREGSIGGAGLDVLPEEPPVPERPLIRALAEGDEALRDRVILTPHSAWYSPESQEDLRRLSMETAVTYLREGALRNCVNAHLL
ncbi:MAG TPA: C-terminal binding protein [Gammaproteobacteria bacterium]|nr:C-terminal binding protein [Gammaproteobacteria bacterium]